MIKKLLHKVVHHFGYDIQRIEYSGRDIFQALELYRASGANAILDVGANQGQFALELLEVDSSLKIFSFEPLLEPHRIAVEASKKFPQWTVCERTAVGNATGAVMMNIAANGGASSSIFEMLPAHLKAAPTVKTTGRESVPMVRMSEFVKSHTELPEKLYLKIDTQGFELEVLKGSEEIFDRIVAIQLELSWVELYAGQPLAIEVIQWLLQKGFCPFGFLNAFRAPSSKELLQSDGFFIKKSALGSTVKASESI